MEHRLIYRWYGPYAEQYSEDGAEVPDRGTLLELDAWEDPVIEHWRNEIAKMVSDEARLQTILDDLTDDEERLISGELEFDDVEHEVRLLEIDRRDICKRLDMFQVKKEQLRRVIKRFGSTA
ncbi:hypothetical protein EXS70_01655 [Candidatus Peribacteria bacterium]|nr:hypothetical protein [Candidatus Peribacteria bacterium]